jgi:biotin carboxyl carrier protein
MYEVEIAGKRRQVSIQRVRDRFAVTIDGAVWTMDAVRIDQHTWSLLVDREVRLADAASVRLSGAETAGVPGLSRTQSYEVTVAADGATALRVRVGSVPLTAVLGGRRRFGRTDEEHAGTEPQRIAAPMPGKVVRVLVAKGARVQARQPVVVVEAMKMENELRAARDGVVTDILVKQGQSVEAGTLLAVIT